MKGAGPNSSLPERTLKLSDVRLSFCIPTYNFGAFIGETLESIISQAGDDVEIVVGDGASTDDTEAVVRSYQARFPGLRYHRFEAKGGIDRDLARTVELSTGRYCWLLSSDDVLKPGACRRILDETRLEHDVYLFNRTICDRDLRPKRYSKLWLSNNVGDRVFHLSQRSDLLEYLNASLSVGALFSYMSSIVVRRDAWNRIGWDVKFAATNYAHVGRLLSILLAPAGTLKYISDELVLFRGDNDSFKEKGYANRILIDLSGYRRFGEHFFAEDGLRQAFKAVMRREHTFYFLPRLKIEIDDEREWSSLQQSLSYYDYSPAEMLMINVLGASKPLVAVARSLKRLLRV